MIDHGQIGDQYTPDQFGRVFTALEPESSLGAKFAVRNCCAFVRPAAKALAAIRQQPQFTVEKPPQT